MKRGREYYYMFMPIIVVLVKIFKCIPYKIRESCFQHCRHYNGYKGILIRYILFASMAKSCGDNVAIHPGCYIYNIQNIECGSNVGINPMCYIQASGGISIGNDVGIAHGVTLESESKNYSKSIGVSEMDILKKKIVIGDNVWIGAKATVLFGRTIGSGAIVGANAVVTKNVEENSIVVGVPAVLKKYRMF